MKTNLASLELHYLLKELKLLIGSRIDNIYNPEKKELMIQLYVTSKGKKILRIIAGKVMYLTEKKEEYGEPTHFCLFLRKHLKSARLREINQLESERIVEFVFENKEGKKKLIVELFARGNILLVDDKILVAAEYHKFRDRTIRANVKYEYPKMPYNFFKLKLGDLKELFNSSKKESLVKCLATELGFGGQYSEEVCMLAEIDKKKKPALLEEKEISSVLDGINDIIHRKIKHLIVYDGNEVKDIVPFELGAYRNNNKKEVQSYNQALNDYFTTLVIKKSPREKQVDKIMRIIEKQKEKIVELKQSEKENREKAEIIYHHYQLINEILTEIRKASAKYSWQEIQKKLKGHKIIQSLDPKEKKISIQTKNIKIQ